MKRSTAASWKPKLTADKKKDVWYTVGGVLRDAGLQLHSWGSELQGKYYHKEQRKQLQNIVIIF
jgi:hypothetical protein